MLWTRVTFSHNRLDEGTVKPQWFIVASSMGGSMGGLVKSMSPLTMETVAVGLVILPMYMLVGGFDWVSTISNTEQSFRAGEYIDVIATGLFYLIRHAAMYVGISKFVVDWGGNGAGIYDTDDSG